MFRLPRPVLGVCALLLVAGCATPPEDPEGTLDRVRGGTMRVGITENDPWTLLDGPSGVEVELVERFAEQLDADIEWTDGSEQDLFGALEAGSIDLVIGGLTSTNPYSKHATFTHPFHTSTVADGIPLGSTFEDIAGVEVAVEKSTEAAGLLRSKTDAVPVYVDDLSEAEGRPAAVDDWLLEDLGLQDSGVHLLESDHVMAVRFGENGWLVELEKFLLEDPGLIDELLAEDTP